MSSVGLMLNSFSLSLQVPSEPAFFIHNSVDLVVPPVNEHDASEEGDRRYESVNEASISEMNPR